MSVFWICFYVISFIVPLNADNSVPITTSNWLTHPAIQEIRKLYVAIESSVKKGQYEVKEKKMQPAVPYGPSSKTIYMDKNRVVRKFVMEAGSEDSSLTYHYYYNNRGLLRFVFITGGAVNGSLMEHRIYFDLKGVRIWEIQKYVKGPGYTFPEVWPEPYIYFHPLEQFNK